jgi:hypothetical protein
MERAVGGLANWRVHWLDGADHSFRVLRSSGKTEAQVYAEVADATGAWLSEIGL